MLLFYFHDIGIPGWLGLVFLALAPVSTYLVVYGIYSLIRHWNWLDLKLKIFSALVPVIALLAVNLFPEQSLLLSFPFGVLSGIPAFIVVSIVYGSEHWIPGFALPYAGLLINICGFVGVIRQVSRFFGYR